MKDIDKIKNKIITMLLSLGFKESVINDKRNYVLGNTHCIPHYFEWLGFFIEYADNKDEALKNWYEDGDGYPLAMGEQAILDGLRAEVINGTPELQQASHTLQAV